MFLKILRRTFWSWWDNLSYSIFTSILGAVNPLYLVLLATIRWILVEDVTFIFKYWNTFFIVLIISLMNIHTFPTTLATYGIQKRLIEGTMTEYFKQYWQELKRVTGRGLLFTLINTAAGFLLAYSIIYYKNALSHIYPFNFVLIGISGWFIVAIVLSQFIMAPLAVRDDFKFFEYYVFSLYMMAKRGFTVLMVSFINFIVFILLTVPVVTPFLTVVPLFSYLGFTATLHNWTYNYVCDEVPDIEVRKRSLREIFSPFIDVFKPRGKDLQENKRNNGKSSS